jgi:tRNA(Arg) A34 adenosine deaminase TadA
MTGDAMPTDHPASQDETFLRLSFDAAQRAMDKGNHPFGAILVDADGKVLMEAGNAFNASRDGTAHAERLLCTEAAVAFGEDALKNCTIYSSAEPCAMCAGAIYWVGIGRVVFGLGEARLKAITGNHPENPTLDMPCRDVFASGQKTIEVLGPLLEDEAAKQHENFWAGKS